MRDLTQQPPAIKISVTQLQCSACGAETHAKCNCGKPYLPKLQRAAEAVAAHPEKSDRAIAADIGVSHTTVQQARQLATDLPVDEPRTGKDGKTRKLPSYIPDAERVRQNPGVLPTDPMQDADLTEQIVDLFQKLTRTAQVRCAMKLRKIMRGEA
jgi:hypothetical protein